MSPYRSETNSRILRPPKLASFRALTNSIPPVHFPTHNWLRSANPPLHADPPPPVPTALKWVRFAPRPSAPTRHPQSIQSTPFNQKLVSFLHPPEMGSFGSLTCLRAPCILDLRGRGAAAMSSRAGIPIALRKPGERGRRFPPKPVRKVQIPPVGGSG